ncbi:MAG: aminotransferase class V-fold PLP-dependent enzyme [Acidobacteriota bacterium]
MLASPSDFLGLDGVTHLSSGGQSPVLASHLAALERYARAKGTGLVGQRRNGAMRASVASKVAALIDAEADDIGFPSSVAHGVGILADSIDWRPGDNVVLEGWEFPSLLYPFLAQQRHGVEVRLVAPRGWSAPLDEFAAAVDARTRVVALSHVSYLTGERHDLEAYAAVAHRVGALFVVDASHALGSVRVHAPVADFVIGCCYKFMLGTHGVAIAAWNRARVPEWRPHLTGWHSVQPRPGWETDPQVRPLTTGQAFEPGNPAYDALHTLDGALDYLLARGIEAIESHTLARSGELRDRLVALGLPVMTPAADAARAASIAFASPAPERVRAQLEAERVLVTGELGRVRASVALFTSDDDLAVAASAIAAATQAAAV